MVGEIVTPKSKLTVIISPFQNRINTLQYYVEAAFNLLVFFFAYVVPKRNTFI